MAAALRPGEIEARYAAPPVVEIEKFLRTLARHDKARLGLGTVLTCNGVRVAAFSRRRCGREAGVRAASRR